MTEPREFKVGDRVVAEFKNGEGKTTSRHVGAITELSETQARVQCAGYLAWIDRDMLVFEA